MRTPVHGEYVTLSGRGVSIHGISTVMTGEGFPKPVVARSMETMSFGEEGARATVILVNRPLLGGVEAPTGVVDADRKTLRRLGAMLGAHSDSESVLVAMDAFCTHALEAFKGARPMLPRRQHLRQEADESDASSWESMSSGSEKDDPAAASSRGLERQGSKFVLVPPEAAAWWTRLPPPRIMFRRGRGFGCLSSTLDRVVKNQCIAGARSLILSSAFRGFTQGLTPGAARKSTHSLQLQLHQLLESRVYEALRFPVIHWLMVKRAARTQRYCAGLTVLRARGDEWVAPEGFAVKESLRTDFGDAIQSLLRVKHAGTPLEAKQALRDSLRAAERCVASHATALGLPEGSLELAAEDKVAVMIHMLVNGVNEAVLSDTVDQRAVLAAAKLPLPESLPQGGEGGALSIALGGGSTDLVREWLDAFPVRPESASDTAQSSPLKWISSALFGPSTPPSSPSISASPRTPHVQSKQARWASKCVSERSRAKGGSCLTDMDPTGLVRNAVTEAELSVVCMEMVGGTESLLGPVSFGMGLHGVIDESAAGMELDYAGATVMQAMAAICAEAPWRATKDEDVEVDMIE
jgi:hypothetical protein